MFCADIPSPVYFLFSNSVPPLLYYSHIPTAILSLLIGFFVYFKSRNMVGKILFTISIVFSLWSFLSLVVWTNVDSQIIMFSWSFFGFLYSLIYILGLYFVYAFIDKKDISLNKKIILGCLLLPIVVFTATNYNITGFDLVNCEAQEGSYFTYYYYSLGLLISLWIIAIAIARYKKAEQNFKKQIIFLTIGIEAFLFSFFTSGFLASYLAERGVKYAFEIEQYGLFGMTIFMGFLAYLIVKFKAFNIKLIAAQALMVALVILIGSEFAFAESNVNKILIGITLALSMAFGWMLVRSVKLEVERKEQLQTVSDKLSQANDQLRKLDNAKTEFISIASHQLRTPLTAIKGFVSLIMEGSYGKVEPKVQDALKKVYISNEHLAQLVEDLLNISRIESGRMQYDFKLCKVESILTELRDNFTLAAKDKGLYLDVKIPETPLPEVEMDSGKIREVISNLIDNALKYTKKGGVTVQTEILNTKSETRNNIQNSKLEIQNSIRITVSDTGIGVPESEMPYIFSKFSRGKDTSRLSVSGTGLGLYVGKAMIEAHQGRIWAESQGSEQGSKFTIELPVKHVA